MKIFLLNKCLLFSLFSLLFSACSSLDKFNKTDLPASYIVNNNELLYDAAINYEAFHASGLLVLKRIKASDYHVVLLSKFGPTIMEFKLDEQGFHWIKTFEKLDKSLVEDFLERDFRMLLLSNFENPKKIKRLKRSPDVEMFKVKGEVNTHVSIDPKTNNVFYTENRGFLNLFKTKVNFTYEDKEVPSTITIRHNNLKLNIHLTLLKIIQD